MSDDTEGSPEPQSSLGLYVIGDQIQDLLNHGYEYITPEEDRAKDQEALASAYVLDWSSRGSHYNSLCPAE